MTTNPEHGDSTRQWLRGLDVFAGPLREFDPEQAPADPVPLFLSWLSEAVADGVRDPHAMTLSTVDAAGDPDSRVLILKNVDASGRRVRRACLQPEGLKTRRAPPGRPHLLLAGPRPPGQSPRRGGTRLGRGQRRRLPRPLRHGQGRVPDGPAELKIRRTPRNGTRR